MYLIPVIDMANHREGSPHAVRWMAEEVAEEEGGDTQGSTMQLVAGAEVAEGEEVRT